MRRVGAHPLTVRTKNAVRARYSLKFSYELHFSYAVQPPTPPAPLPRHSISLICGVEVQRRGGAVYIRAPIELVEMCEANGLAGGAAVVADDGRYEEEEHRDDPVHAEAQQRAHGARDQQ